MQSSLEEARHIVLQNGERFVKVFQNADHCIMFLHVFHRFPHRDFSVEATEKMNCVKNAVVLWTGSAFYLPQLSSQYQVDDVKSRK